VHFEHAGAGHEWQGLAVILEITVWAILAVVLLAVGATTSAAATTAPTPTATATAATVIAILAAPVTSAATTPAATAPSLFLSHLFQNLYLDPLARTILARLRKSVCKCPVSAGHVALERSMNIGDQT
jgi:hypothetical protein